MNEYTPEMVHEAVARGADWLYEKCPNWISEIDLAKLDLESPDRCVLGQTVECLTGSVSRYNGYSVVLAHFREASQWATEHGFDVLGPHEGRPDKEIAECRNDCRGEMAARYEMLTIAWREYIRERLAVSA